MIDQVLKVTERNCTNLVRKCVVIDGTQPGLASFGIIEREHRVMRKGYYLWLKVKWEEIRFDVHMQVMAVQKEQCCQWRVQS